MKIIIFMIYEQHAIDVTPQSHGSSAREQVFDKFIILKLLK